MTKKKPNDADEPRFEVKKRKPKEKPDYFQNIPSFAHPLAEIFKKSPENLETQNSQPLNPNNRDLETQKEIIGNPNLLSSETQVLPFVNPNIADLETQKFEPVTPKNENLETGSDIVGNPNSDDLDADQPKKDIWKPKKKRDLDADQPKIKNLETQTSGKTATAPYLKKYEKARSTEPIHARIEKGIAQRIRHFLVDSKFTLKEFVEMSAIKFMDEFGNPNEKNLDANQPYDDRGLIMWKSKPRLITLYLRYNLIFSGKTRWKPSDDEAACVFNEIDLKVVELGIIQTQVNKYQTDPHGSINSFKFYKNEIEKMSELKLDGKTLEVMLKVNRQRWTQTLGRELDLKFLEEE